MFSKVPRSKTLTTFGCCSERSRLGLPAEPLDEARILGEATVQELERDLAIELLVLGQVDVRHPPSSQAVKNPVAPVDDGPWIEFAH